MARYSVLSLTSPLASYTFAKLEGGGEKIGEACSMLISSIIFGLNELGVLDSSGMCIYLT